MRDVDADRLHKSRFTEESLRQLRLHIETSNGPLDRLDFVVWLEPIHAERVSSVIARAMKDAVWPGDEVRNESLDVARARTDYQLADSQNVASWESEAHYAAVRVLWGQYCLMQRQIDELKRQRPDGMSEQRAATKIASIEYNMGQLRQSQLWRQAIIGDRNTDAIQELSAPVAVPGGVKHLVIGGNHKTVKFQNDLREMAEREGLTYAIVDFIDPLEPTPEEAADYAAYSITYYEEHKDALHQLADPYLASIPAF